MFKVVNFDSELEKKSLDWLTLTLSKIETKSTKVTIYVLHEFKVANWLSSYCLEPWQTNRYQICGRYSKFLHSPLVFSTFLSFEQRCLLLG